MKFKAPRCWPIRSWERRYVRPNQSFTQLPFFFRYSRPVQHRSWRAVRRPWMLTYDLWPHGKGMHWGVTRPPREVRQRYGVNEKKRELNLNLKMDGYYCRSDRRGPFRARRQISQAFFLSGSRPCKAPPGLRREIMEDGYGMV